MLCDNCQLHFDLSSQDYAQVKAETISSLRNSSADASLLELLETDLNDYRDARQLSQSHKRVDICPWVSPDSLPSDLSDIRKEMKYCELPIWKMLRLGNDFKESVKRECEMCIRILEAIQSLDFELDLVITESWLILEPITLLPSAVKILLEENYLEHKFLEFNITERGSYNGCCDSDHLLQCR
jgi:hypothetical protein